MTYRQALREAFVSLLTSWRLLPQYGRALLEQFINALWGLGVALLLLLDPVLALLAPLWAFLVLADERQRARQQAEFRAKVKARYGNRRQMVNRDVG